MEGGQQVAWEKRRATLAAASALGSALLALAAFVYFGMALSEEIGNEAEQVVAYAKQPEVFTISAVIRALASLMLIPALLYLYAAAKARRPETPNIGRVLAVAGPVLLAIGLVMSSLERVNGSEGKTRPLPEKEAEEVLREVPGWVIGFGVGGSLAFAIAFVIISLAAMRAGLLSRFMGILGIGLGVLTGLSSVGGGASAPLQLFYFVALGLLFLDRWPGGRGPAWETGEATPWPSQADKIRAREAEREIEEGAPGAEPAAVDPDTPRPASRKRSRKRR
ncbi:MAG: DUF4386 family protein [Thermoleophilaceae bacterium]|nr:DUF4386 family protein [Thermoleophilaceae bacterium]